MNAKPSDLDASNFAPQTQASHMASNAVAPGDSASAAVQPQGNSAPPTDRSSLTSNSDWSKMFPHPADSTPSNPSLVGSMRQPMAGPDSNPAGNGGGVGADPDDEELKRQQGLTPSNAAGGDATTQSPATPAQLYS
jgi:hypothetical protein